MELIILWLGFVGAWLLFAGPIYQAALELKDQDIERERLHAASHKVSIPRHVSAWWWLLPPIKILFEHRQAKRYQQEYFSLLEPEDFEALLSFINKAQAWLLVAAGGFLIATNETYELATKIGWPLWVFCCVIVGLFLLSISYTIYQLVSNRAVISKQRSQL